MGVGLGFAIAAAVYCRDHEPESRVVCVEGDSAFGFSGMEVETMMRQKLPVVLVIFNNNGIYRFVLLSTNSRKTPNNIKEYSHTTICKFVSSFVNPKWI